MKWVVLVNYSEGHPRFFSQTGAVSGVSPHWTRWHASSYASVLGGRELQELAPTAHTTPWHSTSSSLTLSPLRVHSLYRCSLAAERFETHTHRVTHSCVTSRVTSSGFDLP